MGIRSLATIAFEAVVHYKRPSETYHELWTRMKYAGLFDVLTREGFTEAAAQRLDKYREVPPPKDVVPSKWSSWTLF